MKEHHPLHNVNLSRNTNSDAMVITESLAGNVGIKLIRGISRWMYI